MTGQHLTKRSERTSIHHLTICIYSVFQPRQYSLQKTETVNRYIDIAPSSYDKHSTASQEKFECFGLTVKGRTGISIRYACPEGRYVCRKKIGAYGYFTHCDPEASARMTWTLCAAQFSSQCRKHDAVSVSTLLYGAAPQQQWAHKSS